MSMVPSRRVTIARRVSLDLPIPVRVRCVLPLRLMVFPEETLTSKMASTACLISVLLDPGATMNVYWPRSMQA